MEQIGAKFDADDESNGSGNTVHRTLLNMVLLPHATSSVNVNPGSPLTTLTMRMGASELDLG